MDQEVVTELIQENCSTKNIKSELQKILNPDHRKELLANYLLLEEKLGGGGASKKTAQHIVRSLSK
jgi:lipid-A-disaccharide synthase